MYTFFSFIPTWTLTETIIHVAAALGVILHIYGVFLESERKQDVVFAIGGALLFMYAWYLHSTIFMVAMAGFTIGSIIEYVEILLHKHQHVCEP